MKMTFHSGHFAETASASEESTTPVRNFTPSFSTSFCALRTAVAGSPVVSSKMNSTGRPRMPFALTSFANRSAARLAWMPYWALPPDSAAGIPILIEPCAHARRRNAVAARVAAESARKRRLSMIGLLGSRPDYSEEDGLASRGAGTEEPAKNPVRPADFQRRRARAVRGDRRRLVPRPAGAHVTRAVHEDVVEPGGPVVGSNRLVADDAP